MIYVFVVMLDTQDFLSLSVYCGEEYPRNDLLQILSIVLHYHGVRYMQGWILKEMVATLKVHK